MNVKNMWSNTKFIGRCAKEAGTQVTLIVGGGVIAAGTGIVTGSVVALVTAADVCEQVGRKCSDRLDQFVEREKLHIGSPLSRVVAVY